VTPMRGIYAQVFLYRMIDMAFSIKSKAADAAVRRLAKLKKKTLTETILEAVDNEYRRARGDESLIERLEALSERYKTFPETGLQADKAFFDEMSGDV
jgi:antitoxin VapB